MRESLDTAENPIIYECHRSTVDDAESVDNTSGIIWNVFTLLLRVWWLWFTLIALLAFSFPYIFPDFAKQNFKELHEIRIAANTKLFFENVKNIKWEDALTPESLERLTKVGTGRDQIFKDNPELKEHWWKADLGLLMMKDYVTQWSFDGGRTDSEYRPDVLFPATDIEFGEAAAYCASLGQDYGLPTYAELELALAFLLANKSQGKMGALLKSNLELNINPEYLLWTVTPESDGFWSGDNRRIFDAGNPNSRRFEDDGFNSENLSFLCIRRLTK